MMEVHGNGDKAISPIRDRFIAAGAKVGTEASDGSNGEDDAETDVEDGGAENGTQARSQDA